MDDVGEPDLAGRPAGGWSRALWVGRSAARWVAYCTVSFAVMAGVLLLAHI
jgi:hypothetical protein